MDRATPPFLRRLRAKSQKTLLHQHKPQPVGRYLEYASHASQIVLVALAIFGYFYTVRPVYQKERLEEQVAQLEILRDAQLANLKDARKRLDEISGEREALFTERQDLSEEISKMRSELAAVKRDKSTLDAQIRFMDYKFRLPDGAPAKTHEQVEVAKAHRARQAEESAKLTFFANLQMMRTVDRLNATFSNADGTAGLVPLFDRNSEISTGDPSFPFTNEEIDIWRTQRSAYVRNLALNALSQSVSKFVELYTDSESPSTENIQQWTGWLRDRVQQSSVELPEGDDPKTIVQECRKQLDDFDKEVEKKIADIENKYGDWESVWGSNRRAIAKHNYEVSIHNVKALTRNDRFNIVWSCNERANKIRDQVEQAVETLLDVNTTNEI